MQTIESFLTRNPDAVAGETTVTSLASKFASRPHRHLLVVDEEDRLVGVVRRAAVLAALERPTTTAADLMSGAVVVSHRGSLVEALSALVGEREDIVVAVDDAMQPVGVLTEHDGVRIAATRLDETLAAGDAGRRTVESIGAEATLGEARRRMAHHDIRHLVVTSDESVVGVVSERDLLAHGAARHTEATVRSVLAERGLLKGHPDDSLAEIARGMLDHGIGCVPLFEGPELVGIVTGTDVIRALVRLLSD